METLERTTIKIIDGKGYVLHTEDMGRTKGINHLNICGSDLNVGSYTCRIITGNKEKNIQFTKA